MVCSPSPRLVSQANYGGVRGVLPKPAQSSSETGEDGGQSSEDGPTREDSGPADTEDDDEGVRTERGGDGEHPARIPCGC